MLRVSLELFLPPLSPLKRTFVSVTLISIIGATLGVAVRIIVMSVMTGFDRQLRQRLILTRISGLPKGNQHARLCEGDEYGRV
jgi:ABC-type lipoprotein release transport system permease subunit